MIKVYAEASKLDDNSIGFILDVDGIKDVDAMLAKIIDRLKKSPQVNILDVAWWCIYIYLTNKREERSLTNARGSDTGKEQNRKD